MPSGQSGPPPPAPGWPAPPGGQPQPPGGPAGTPGPPPGPPGWSPSGPPPGGSQSSKTPWLIALAVVAVVAVAGVIFLATGDDDDDEPRDRPGGEETAGPIGAVEEFMAAEADQDCSAVMELLTPNALQQGYGTSDPSVAMQSCEDFIAQEQSAGVNRDRTVHNIEVVSEGDGEATVAVNATDTITNGAEESSTYSQEIYLVDEGGTWLIDRLGAPEV